MLLRTGTYSNDAGYHGASRPPKENTASSSTTTARGKHIANEAQDHLYSPRGQNVGHSLPDQGIFIDLRGRYLGEILHGNRHLSHRSLPWRSNHFGNFGNTGNIGNASNSGNVGRIGLPVGNEGINPAKLGR